MPITPSDLRRRVYAILDEVIDTGTPVEVVRRGHRLRIVSDEPPSKLARLRRRPTLIAGDPEQLVHLDWSGGWRP